ncbi:hypothetical protein CISIN_1g010307mg [Citrus sinensis]|uniref:CCZ1/INTU/HSP4 first Longin domain-containing protein n=1 Tax=Citrus sinensis TaxID=2711 RepID=A0A067F0E6_CITSI|nr:hypothetical protein CISIN_1g010307mg [Citrus sinensis]
MGLASASTATDGMQLCIFDLRRGQNEGQELDKILFFFPADLPFSTQLSVIGLSEGLITFTRIFSPEAACEIIEAERHSHVFYEAETDIWMVMADFPVGKKLQLPSFRDCLKERGTVQMLTMGREAAIEVQSLVSVLDSCAGNSSCYSMILFHDLLVSTTLSPDDTINLFTYAVLRLSPNALSSGVNSWSYIRRGSTSSHFVSGSALTHSGPVSEQIYHSSDTSPVGNNINRVTRALQHGKWYKGKDGFLVTDIWGVDVGSLVCATPTVWLQQTEEAMYLCPYQFKSLTLILLIPVSSILNGEQGVALVKQQLLENASLKILKVEEKLSKGWGGENAYHVSGYRYLLVDGDRNISRASPPGKVTTLAKESLLALSKLRDEVDLEKSRAKRDNAGCEKDLEVSIRAKNNAWAIARITGGKELYMVLEKASETLLYASDAVEKFSNRYCNGAFSLD